MFINLYLNFFLLISNSSLVTQVVYAEGLQMAKYTHGVLVLPPRIAEGRPQPTGAQHTQACSHYQV